MRLISCRRHFSFVGWDYTDGLQSAVVKSFVSLQVLSSSRDLLGSLQLIQGDRPARYTCSDETNTLLDLCKVLTEEGELLQKLSVRIVRCLANRDLENKVFQ